MALLKDLLGGLENITSDLQPGIQQLANYAIAERDRKDENARFQQQFQLMQNQDTREAERQRMDKERNERERIANIAEISKDIPREEVGAILSKYTNDQVMIQEGLGLHTLFQKATTAEERKKAKDKYIESGGVPKADMTTEEYQAGTAGIIGARNLLETREKEATIGEKNANIAESGFRGQLYKAEAENIGKPGEKGAKYNTQEYHKFVDKYIETHPNIPGVDMEKEAADKYFQRLQYMRAMDKMLEDKQEEQGINTGGGFRFGGGNGIGVRRGGYGLSNKPSNIDPILEQMIIESLTKSQSQPSENEQFQNRNRQWIMDLFKMGNVNNVGASRLVR